MTNAWDDPYHMATLTVSEGVGNELLGELVGRCVGEPFSLLGGWGDSNNW